jgi:hypothetical protein
MAGACAVALLTVGPPMVAGAGCPRMGRVPGLDLGGTGRVARIVLSADGSGVGVLRDTGNAVGEVVQEPDDQGVRAFGLAGPSGLGRRCDRLASCKFPKGDHVGFTRRCCALAGGALTGTI